MTELGTDTMRLRYERIRIEKHWVDPTIERNRKWANEPEDQFPPNNLLTCYSIRVCSVFHVAAGYFLADDPANSRLWANRLIAETKHYFFGEWRMHEPENPLRPQDEGKSYWAEGGGEWITYYRAAVAFAAAMGDQSAINELSVHPTHEKTDASPWTVERPWLLLLAEHFRAGCSMEYELLLSEIRRNTAKAPKIVAECLDAIAKQRTDEIDDRFAAQMKYYLKNQKKRDEMEYKLAFDSTILYHLASRKGHEISMDDFHRDHLIIFD